MMASLDVAGVWWWSVLVGATSQRYDSVVALG